MIVYGIINKLNHKMYTGISIKDDITSKKSRAYQHLHGIGKSFSKVVFQAVQKYGIENFLVIILHKENCTREKLKELEKYYILHFGTKSPKGYNLTDGGDGASGYKFTEESKKKCSDSAKISANRPETKKKQAETWSNKSEEEKAEHAEKVSIFWNHLSEKEKLSTNQKRSESGKIAQNNPDAKQKIATIRANKSEEEKLEFSSKMSDIGKIVQNNPKVKKKRLDTWNNKSEAEKAETRKKQSASGKIAQNKTELKNLRSEYGRYYAHIRHHFNRGIINVDCEHCIEQIMKEHS